MAVLDVRPGDLSIEDEHFERMWTANLTMREMGLRGGSRTTDVLSPEQYKELERKLRHTQNLCMKCGSDAHYANACQLTPGTSDSFGKVFIRSSMTRALRELEVEDVREVEDSWDTEIVSEEDVDVEFGDYARDDKDMFSRIYNCIPKDNVLAVGNLRQPTGRVRGVAPDFYQEMGFAECSEAQKAFQSSIMSAIDQETGKDVVFLNVGTGGGKSLAFILAAVEAASARGCRVLILLPQRNVVEDMARSLAGLSVTDRNRRKELDISDMGLWDASHRGTASVVLGGEIATVNGAIRWSVYMGNAGIPSLRKLMSDQEWMDRVDILVGTVDMVYSKFLPPTFVTDLRLVLFDEADMAKDDFGANISYMFGQMRMVAHMEDNPPLIFGLGTATCKQPMELACTLLNVSPDRVKLIQDSAEESYTNVYQRTQVATSSLEVDHETDIPPSALELCDSTQTLGATGRMLVFYQCKSREARTATLLAMLDRRNHVKGAASISFHSSKHEISRTEATLRKLDGQTRLFFSYTGDHPKAARMLRGTFAHGKHMLATSAARVGQNIAQTRTAFLDLDHDRTALIQGMGRAGRDSTACVFICCEDIEVDPLSALVAEDAGTYLRGGQHTIRIPRNSPSIFYKNACVFLDRLATYPSDIKHWSKTFAEFVHVPPLCLDASVTQQMTLRDARSWYFAKFMESTFAAKDVARQALLRAREFDPKVPIVRSRDGRVVAEVSRAAIYQHYFPGSIQMSVHDPSRSHWVWEAFTFYKDEDVICSTISIDDVRKVFIGEVMLSPSKVSVYTRGRLKTHNPPISRDRKPLQSRKLDDCNGGQIEMHVQLATKVRQFDHYVKVFERPGEAMYSDEKDADTITHVPTVDVWGDGSQYLERTLSWTLSASLESDAHSLSSLRERKPTLRFTIEEYFGVSCDTFDLMYQVKPDRGKRISIKLSVTETCKGRPIGLCFQLMHEIPVRRIMAAICGS